MTEATDTRTYKVWSRATGWVTIESVSAKEYVESIGGADMVWTMDPRWKALAEIIVVDVEADLTWYHFSR